VDRILGLELGADDYVTKPFSPKVLVRRVNALLRRAGSGAETLRFGDLAIHPDRYEATNATGRIPLTTREFELLAHFARNAGRVLTREQLLNQVWGYDYFGDGRIVDAHIKNLRKKIGTDAIQTVFGLGYKWGANG